MLCYFTQLHAKASLICRELCDSTIKSVTAIIVIPTVVKWLCGYLHACLQHLHGAIVQSGCTTHLTPGSLILNRQVSFSDHAAFISCPTFGIPSHDTVNPTEPTG